MLSKIMGNSRNDETHDVVVVREVVLLLALASLVHVAARVTVVDRGTSNQSVTHTRAARSVGRISRVQRPWHWEGSLFRAGTTMDHT